MRKYVDENHTHEMKDIIDFSLSPEVKNEIRLSILYTFVDYIESDGKCYIDTGFIPNQDTRVISKAKLEHNSGNEFLFGARSAIASNTYAYSNYTSSKCRTHYNKTYLDFDLEHDTTFTVDKNKNITTINDGINNGVIEHEYAIFTCPVSMYLFCVNNNGAANSHSTASIYSMQIYDNDVLIRDFIPVYHNILGEYGLYDRVNDIYYPNKGSGTLTGGKD